MNGIVIPHLNKGEGGGFVMWAEVKNYYTIVRPEQRRPNGYL